MQTGAPRLSPKRYAQEDMERSTPLSSTISFDSNVWERIVDEHKRSVEALVYTAIYDLIRVGKIIPYFFEGIVAMESIPKKDRKDFYGNFRAGFVVEVDGEVVNNKPGSGGPKITDYLNENVPKAIAIGFRFTAFPRIGAPLLNIPEHWWAPDSNYPIEERQQRSFECATFIESLGAGKAKLMNGMHSSPGGIVQKAKKDTLLSDKQFAKGLGEWVDGDALAAHYGYGFDYFCTNDTAAGAGSSSVFAKENLQQLEARYKVNVVSPEELVAILQA